LNASFASAAAPAAANIAPDDLGALGGIDSIALDVNDRGEAIVNARLADDTWPVFVASPGTAPRVLPTLGGEEGSNATDINELGQIAGTSTDENNVDARAVLWPATGGVVDLGTLGGTESHGLALNDLGQVVGWAKTPSGVIHGFLWSAGTGMVDVGTLGGSFSHAREINNAGTVLGITRDSAGNDRSFRWDPLGGIQAIGGVGATAWSLNERGQFLVQNGDGTEVFDPVLGFVPIPDTVNGLTTYAQDINESGLVVGYAIANQSETARPFVWAIGLPVAVVIDPLASESYASFVNDHNQVLVEGENGVAVVWSPHGPPITLDRVDDAVAMNDTGQLIGTSWFPTAGTLEDRHGARWRFDTPVQVHWSAAEYGRIQQLMRFYGMDYDELTKFGVYVAAFVNAIDPQPGPTPITVAPPGSAQTQIITWHANEIGLLEAVKYRWVLDDEGAHRWGFMLLSFIATIQGA
jgi:probable HAF family extracellular repeat protein